MNLEQLQNTVIDALEDVKGQNIQVFNAQPMTSMFDRVVIVSGTSNRQTRGDIATAFSRRHQPSPSCPWNANRDVGQ